MIGRKREKEREFTKSLDLRKGKRVRTNTYKAMQQIEQSIQDKNK